MKKKIRMAIPLLCVAMAMTACGGNADTAEVKETTATEESAEAKADADTEDQEKAEEQARLEEAEGYYEAGRRSLYGLDGARIDMEDAHANFTKAEELGYTDANFYLGALADWYRYPEQDYEKARVYYEQCEDNPYAQIALGFLYYNYQILDMESNEDQREKGKKLFQSVTDQGVADGCLGLAAVAEDEEDYETALKNYEKAAKEGTEQLYVIYAMNSIGGMYDYGYGVEEDANAAIEWYTKAADLGDSEAMNSIAMIYWRGKDNVVQDVNAAIEWYTKSADSGNSEAMNLMGAMYHNGDGVEQDFDAAMEWCQKAADLGHAQAMTNVAYMYRHGNGVAQDGGAAIEWYRKAADSGELSAMCEIGDMYRNGEGVEQDDDKALEWYVKSLSSLPDYEVYKKIADILHGEDAAEKWFEETGDAEKMMALAELYRSHYSDNGEQLLPDFDKAVEWYTKAADLGSSEAMERIGDLYRLGSLYGREDDLDKAMEWYQKAADSGNEEAQSYLEHLQGQ